MVKDWNYVGKKVHSRHKTGTLRRKLGDVRQPVVRYLPAYETFHWASKWRFIYPYLLASIIPIVYHYGHKLKSQIFLTIYFCTRFFASRNFASTSFASQNFHIYFSVCCFFAIKNKCTNISDTNNNAKNDVAKIKPQTFLWIFFCNNNFCVKNC